MLFLPGNGDIPTSRNGRPLFLVLELGWNFVTVLPNRSWQKWQILTLGPKKDIWLLSGTLYIRCSTLEPSCHILRKSRSSRRDMQMFWPIGSQVEVIANDHHQLSIMRWGRFHLIPPLSFWKTHRSHQGERRRALPANPCPNQIHKQNKYYCSFMIIEN